jgi:DNA-binding winged helix-turn-helix (wHTH) protein
MILEHVWGPEWVEDAQTLRVHVSHLRKKIEPSPAGPRYIVTEPGVGFRLGQLRVMPPNAQAGAAAVYATGVPRSSSRHSLSAKRGPCEPLRRRIDFSQRLVERDPGQRTQRRRCR